MEQYTVRQGDQYSIPFQITLDGSLITNKMIDGVSPELNGDVEIVIGKLRKTYRDEEVKFNTKTFTFDFPFTQDETFNLRPGMRLKSQVRVKLKKFNPTEDNFIFSYNGPDVLVISSLSREKI